MKSVKIKTAKRQLSDKGVVNMFNQMLGAEDADPAIIIPKYSIIKTKVQSLYKILGAAVDDVIRKSFPDEKKGCDDVVRYIESLTSIEFIDIPTQDNLTPEISKSISKDYIRIKSDNNIKLIILTCKNLIGYSGKLSVGDTFDDSFIKRIPGYEFNPFPFSSLNIKRIWASPNITDRIKKYIFTVMNIILDISKEIYKTITSPDVDVKEFSKVIIKSISQVKKQVPRCEKAFAKIEQSVGLLEGNFDGYYKDFIQSQNPSTIIESFVIDVSQSGGADSQTTRQFRTIINYYRKATQGKIKDPKIKKVFDMLNDNFNQMETETAKTDETTEDNITPLTKSLKRRNKKRQKDLEKNNPDGDIK
jgi:hypothetical protein